MDIILKLSFLKEFVAACRGAYYFLKNAKDFALRIELASGNAALPTAFFDYFLLPS